MSMKLVILGLLLERNMHPYEINVVMKDRSIDRIMKLQMGSLYYAVDKLSQEGLITAVEIVRSSDRPDKTIYAITEEGKAIFEQMVLQQIKKNNPVFHPLYIALSLSRYVDPDKLAVLLKERILEAEHEVNLAFQIYEEHIPLVPRAVLHMMYGRYEHGMAELKWLKRFYEDVAQYKLNEVGKALNLEA
ncbi:PadR family transcriptional regulator [Paenibacillus albidus]|uniref:PadR family transcriptional regulator n=1 Tax=Paenibacillus albidus TaxID=2041023 RepID=UPI001BE800E1|nr:PadR family transcriptional regulator [Paenibacillus albidus]MBT2289936.1 PadR family transcriptional regulator [Paenibacillus albidus]